VVSGERIRIAFTWKLDRLAVSAVEMEIEMGIEG